MPDTARGTFERVRGREPRALAELATLYGRSLVGLAFIVLQNRPASERAAARAIAECWRLEPDAWPRDPNQMVGELLAAAARAALIAHPDVSEVDPTPRPGASELLRLDPSQRAQAAHGAPHDIAYVVLVEMQFHLARLDLGDIQQIVDQPD